MIRKLTPALTCVLLALVLMGTLGTGATSSIPTEASTSITMPPGYGSDETKQGWLFWRSESICFQADLSASCPPDEIIDSIGSDTIDLSQYHCLYVRVTGHWEGSCGMYQVVWFNVTSVQVLPVTPCPCPAEVALEGKGSDLNTLRKFRDEVLAQSPIGRRYIDIYYKHSPEIVKMLVLDSDLRSRTREMLEKCMPVIGELLDEGTGQEVVLTEGMLKEIEVLLNDFAKKASPGLRAAIGEMRKQLEYFEGKTLREAWQSMSTTDAGLE